jgi:hypothetical protein
MESKRAKMRPVNYWKTALLIFAVLSASLAFAEDFRTVNGKEYKDATIIRVEADGIVLRTKTGISKVYFFELPQDVQQKFRRGPATPSAAQREGEATKLETKQQGSPQPDRGGRVVIVGQTGISWKVIVGGIVVLVVVVLAVVRNRF